MGKIISLIIFVFTWRYIYKMLERIRCRNSSTDGFTYIDWCGQLRYLKNNAAVHWGKGYGLRSRPLIDDNTGGIYMWSMDIYNRNQAKIKGEEVYDIVENKGWTEGFLKDIKVQGDVETTQNIFIVQLNGKEYLLNADNYTILRESKRSKLNNRNQTGVDIVKFNELMNTKVEYTWDRPKYIEYFTQLSTNKKGE